MRGKAVGVRRRTLPQPSCSLFLFTRDPTMSNIMDSLHQEILSDSAFDSIIHSDLTLSHPFASLPEPAFHSRLLLDFPDRLDDEDLFSGMHGPVATAATDSHKDLSTRLRRRKASQPQRLVYCDLNFASREDAANSATDTPADEWNGSLSEEPDDRLTAGTKSETSANNKSLSGTGLTCGTCDQQFPDKKSLRSHKKEHAAQKCVCPVCGMAVFNKTVLKNHMKRIHERPERSFHCQTCDKKFVSKAELNQHSFIHSEEKNFSCQTCGKKFASKPYLERHHKTHTGVKAFTCEICHKQLADKTGFTAHVRAHNNERPFCCTFCDKRYTIKRHLTSHLRIHSAVRPFRCEVPECGKTFRSRSNLRMHKDFHAGVKRWTCQHCDRSFLSQGNMAKHVRRHIGERKYACDVCGKAFIEKQELKSHQKVHADVSESSSRSQPLLTRSSSFSSSQDVPSQESSPCGVTSSLTPDSMVMITVIDDGQGIDSQQTVLATEIGSDVASYANSHFLSSDSVLSTDQTQRLPSISSFQYHVLSNADVDHTESIYNCTLCSNCYQHAASLRDHLVNYHRVEADKIH